MTDNECSFKVNGIGEVRAHNWIYVMERPNGREYEYECFQCGETKVTDHQRFHVDHHRTGEVYSVRVDHDEPCLRKALERTITGHVRDLEDQISYE